MANTDEYGNKIAAKKEKKSIKSQRIREYRMITNTPNPKHCKKCGFRIRGKNHPCKITKAKS